MIKIQQRVPLAPYTTLKIGGPARFFVVVKSLEDLKEALTWAKEKKEKIFILGGGSNVLITKPFSGLVIKNEISGSEVVKESAQSVWFAGYSGENWQKFVDTSVSHDWSGLENLASIYGTVGAAPVQNIGAYGQELKDIFYSLEAINLKTGQLKVFKGADCQFGYRDSIFKKSLKGKYFIYRVTVKLSKKPCFNLDYGGLKEILAAKRIKTPTVRQVARAVSELRATKLPTPALLPNAGSFFKNPEVTASKFKKIQKRWPEIKYFPGSKPGTIKIPAGWLIEQAGFKGKRFGAVGVYEKQALILVNYGGASAAQVLAQVKRVIKGVRDRFGLTLEPEVNIIPPLPKK